ncbi:MAG: zinc-ribbon domain-containing protein [Pirellulaceae bacterium]
MDIQCSGCGQKYRVADELAGKQVRCKKCNGTIVVKGAKAETPQWYFQKSGFAGDETVGPLTMAQLRALMGKGELSPKTGVFHPQATSGSWVALADTPLAGVFAAVEQQKQKEKEEARLAREETLRQQAEEKEALRQKKLAEQEARRELEAQQREQQLVASQAPPALVSGGMPPPVTEGFAVSAASTCWYCQLPADLYGQQCVYCRMIN